MHFSPKVLASKVAYESVELGLGARARDKGGEGMGVSTLSRVARVCRVMRDGVMYTGNSKCAREV